MYIVRKGPKHKWLTKVKVVTEAIADAYSNFDAMIYHKLVLALQRVAKSGSYRRDKFSSRIE